MNTFARILAGVTWPFLQAMMMEMRNNSQPSAASFELLEQDTQNSFHWGQAPTRRNQDLKDAACTSYAKIQLNKSMERNE
jgi:hypothetical protein